MKVADFMTAPPLTVEMDATLASVQELFEGHQFHHVPVVYREDGKLAGVISDRDLLRSISNFVGTGSETTRDIATLEKPAHQVMTRKPVTIKEEANLQDVIAIFCEHGFSCIPVVDSADCPTGIVSWRDVLAAVRQQETTLQGTAAEQ